jgi:hypothetical protein
LRPGDWVMKSTADEFYHLTPPQFVRERACGRRTRRFICSGTSSG